MTARKATGALLIVAGLGTIVGGVYVALGTAVALIAGGFALYAAGHSLYTREAIAERLAEHDTFAQHSVNAARRLEERRNDRLN